MLLETLNKCKMASIAISTTGYNQYEEDLIEVAIIPMHEMSRDTERTFFNPIMLPIHKTEGFSRPKLRQADAGFYVEAHYGCLSAQAYATATHGIEQSFAADQFDKWFNELNLHPGRMITPLCYDWSYIKDFLTEWLGRETVRQCFDYRVRDFVAMATWENDYANIRYGKTRFGKVDANHLFRHLGFEEQYKLTAIERAHEQIACYNQLVSQRAIYEGF